MKRKAICEQGALLLVAALVSPMAVADVHRCTDPAGKVTYQSQPCPDASTVRILPARAAAAAPNAKPPAAAPRLRSEHDGPVSLTALDTDLEAPVRMDGGDKPAPKAPERPAIPELPRTQLKFDLLSIDGTRLRWTNTGPEGGQRHDGLVRGGAEIERPPGPAVLNDKGTEGYALLDFGRTLVWMPKGFAGPKQELRPPSHLPPLSWISGLAWDTRQGVLALVSSSGGEGYFYRYDTRKHRWLDVRSRNKGLDLQSLAFDEGSGTFFAISRGADLVTFSDQGELRQVRPLADLLPGLREIYRNGRQAEGLLVVARGGVVALVSVRKASVSHIWTYETAAGRAQLTYKAMP